MTISSSTMSFPMSSTNYQPQQAADPVNNTYLLPRNFATAFLEIELKMCTEELLNSTKSKEATKKKSLS